MIGEFLDKTLNRYKITGRKLAATAHVDKTQVSEIRRGLSEPGGGTLIKLLDAMEQLAPGSKLHFCLLLAGKNPDLFNADAPINPVTLVDSLDSKQLATLLSAIAERFSVTLGESSKGGSSNSLSEEKIAV